MPLPIPSPLPALILVAAVCLGVPCRAQPGTPPPGAATWWNLRDNDTISVRYDFDDSTWPPTPTSMVVPGWFGGIRWTKSSSVQWMRQITDHQGVWGITQAGVAKMEADVDNDPRTDWIKIFAVEFDAYFTGSNFLAATASSPASSSDHNTQMTVDDIGNGWMHMTIEMDMVPQPDDEQVAWSLDLSDVGSPVAVDNVSFSAHCEPEDFPEDTNAGPVGDSGGITIVASTISGNSSTRGVAVTRIPGASQSYWVSASAEPPAPGQPHVLFEFNGSGSLVATHDQPTAYNSPSQIGLRDLTSAGAFVYGLIENGMGGWEMQCFDTVNRVWDPLKTVQLDFLPPGSMVAALAHNPHGDGGLGTFWTVDQNGTAYEYDRVGNLLSTADSGGKNVMGAAFDPASGHFWFFDAEGPGGDPRNIKVVVKGWDYKKKGPSGVQFYGDLGVVGDAASPMGGRALGMAAYRDPELKLVLLVDAEKDTLYEVRAPFQFGFSCIGNIGMDGGPPFPGNSDWKITLEGIHGATAAGVYLGLTDKTYLGQMLPYGLGLYGLPTCTVLISLDSFGGPASIMGDRAVMSIPIPNTPAMSGLATYWQWVVLSPHASSMGIGLSNAGSVRIR